VTFFFFVLVNPHGARLVWASFDPARAPLRQQRINQPTFTYPNSLATSATLSLPTADPGIHIIERSNVMTLQGGIDLGFQDGGAYFLVGH
jgi:hypothetical protein